MSVGEFESAFRCVIIEMAAPNMSNDEIHAFIVNHFASIAEGSLIHCGGISV